MPRSRFSKLDQVEQLRILDIAAQHFAEQGYTRASINVILHNAGLSKGAAYYYFDDKADVFATTIEHYFSEIAPLIVHTIDHLTIDTYWAYFEEAYKRPFLSNIKHPYRFGVLKALATVPQDDPIQERLAPINQAFYAWLETLIQKGQSFGLVRTDLPSSLLYGLIEAVDGAGDVWVLTHIATLETAGVTTILSQIVSALRGMLAPQEEV